MPTIFGIPKYPVGDDDDAISMQSRYSPHVLIAYPRLEDWLNLYDPYRSRDTRANRQSYKSLRQHHLLSVTKQLDVINSKLTGRAVFAELSAAPHEVFIFPFDFLPSRDWRIKVGVTKMAVTVPFNADHSAKKGIPLCRKTRHGKVSCFAAPGGGGRVEIYFEKLRASGSEHPDEVLLHELVHATRQMRGLRFHVPMSGGYGNKEEFFANLIENIYRSEKRLPPVWYGGHSMTDPNKFLDTDSNLPLRTVIATLRSEQGGLFAAIARIATPFNPIRQVDMENKAYATRINRG
jgi:hypothetical protein